MISENLGRIIYSPNTVLKPKEHIATISSYVHDQGIDECSMQQLKKVITKNIGWFFSDELGIPTP